MGQLGYWWAYRILDARHFGVPQRRRRVFIVALHAGAGFGADSAAAVLSVGTRCGRHPATGHQTGEGVAELSVPSVDRPGWGSISHALTRPTSNARYDPNGESYVVGALSTDLGHHGGAWGSQAVSSGHVIADGQHGSPPDPGGVRAPDGLAGGLDDLAPTLRVGPARPQDGGPGDTVPIVAAYRKSARVSDPGSPETWVDDGLANTLNSFDVGDIRTTHLALDPAKERDAAGLEHDVDSLLPLGLDSHRYRCCGNGVVSNVSEWIGMRLRGAVEGEAAA